MTAPRSTRRGEGQGVGVAPGEEGSRSTAPRAAPRTGRNGARGTGPGSPAAEAPPGRGAPAGAGALQVLYLSDIRFPIERANGIQTIETCHALARRGLGVTLVVRPDTVRPPRDPFAFYGLPPDPHLRIERVRTAGPALVRRALYLAGALARAAAGHHTVVLTRDLGAAALALRLPRSRRPPVVYEAHGIAADVAGSLGALIAGAHPASRAKQQRLLARERFVWARADGYVTITRGLARDLEARFGPRLHLRIIPDGVRLPPDRTFAPPAPGRAGEAVIGYAGHLYPWKGVDLLVRALALLPACRALIVGGHPGEADRARLADLAAELGVADRVELTGFVPPPQVADHLARADVLVLPNPVSALSFSWTSPLKLFEYLAAGRPIVASDLPAFREVLADGENALLVTPGDAAAIAAAVRRLLDDGPLARRLARRAWEDAARYTWDARAAAIEGLLREVVAGAT
jgi:glycosyltransferase involved in cell wall biosynthesis